jgi:DNA helicase HerA-like ATPase
MSAAITELGVGEALISFLDAKGRPGITERVFVLPPGSQIGPITPAQRQALVAGSLVAGRYETTEDRESAYEKLKARVAATPTPAEAAKQAPAGDGGMMGELRDVIFGSTGPRGGRRPGLAEAAATSAVRSIGSTMGREIIRGVLGSLFGGRRR